MILFQQVRPWLGGQLGPHYIIEMAKDIDVEYEKRYGMGNILHRELIKQKHNVGTYAPIPLFKLCVSVD